MASTTREENNKEQKSGGSSDVSKPSLNMEELRELADLIEKRGFTDFEFENEKIRVRMSRAAARQIDEPVKPARVVSQPTPESEAVTETVEQVADPDEGLLKITAPIVGTFYRASSPDKDPYVKEGDIVSSDTVVCIVEAMKLMNEIYAETSGEIVKIYVENGQPVEYGQALFGIKK